MGTAPGRTAGGRRRRDEGAALAEFALVIPFLVLGRRLSAGLGPRTYRYA